MQSLCSKETGEEVLFLITTTCFLRHVGTGRVYWACPDVLDASKTHRSQGMSSLRVLFFTIG